MVLLLLLLRLGRCLLRNVVGIVGWRGLVVLLLFLLRRLLLLLLLLCLLAGIVERDDG
jgi:hypothetical protein